MTDEYIDLGPANNPQPREPDIPAADLKALRAEWREQVIATITDAMWIYKAMNEGGQDRVDLMVILGLALDSGDYMLELVREQFIARHVARIEREWLHGESDES